MQPKDVFALDLRLHVPHLPDLPNSKVNGAVTELEHIWRETAARSSNQRVFYGLSTPGRGFSVNEDMRDKLVAEGIPLAEIVFMQDYDSDAAKAAQLQDVRNRAISSSHAAMSA